MRPADSDADTPRHPPWTADLLRSPHDVPDKAGRVRRMFRAIAPRYELVNSLFSLGRDRYWRRRAVELAGTGPGDDVLDVACGTGDFSRVFADAGARFVIGCDFAHEMLTLAGRRRKTGAGPRGLTLDLASLRQGQAPAARYRESEPAGPRAKGRRSCKGACDWSRVECDALRLPFQNGGFSITSCAFGVRNFDNLDVGLKEMYRVLRPGGRAVILEFTRPANRFIRRVYEFYSSRLMPLAATLVSGDRSGAYRYLPRSVVSFLSTEQMLERLQHAGFIRSTATPLTRGVVTVYVATRD